jgi:hypothetical protein
VVADLEETLEVVAELVLIKFLQQHIVVLLKLLVFLLYLFLLQLILLQ